jgi:hypothetical protein
MLIDMLGIPLFNDPIDEFLFNEIVDPLLPFQGMPLPLPVRIGAYVVELQVEAGQAIAQGKVAGKPQYTGQAGAQANAANLGYNLIYQPGGMKI